MFAEIVGYVLLALYGVAWAVPAPDPFTRVSVTAMLCAVFSFPVFLWDVLKVLLVSGCMAGCLTGLIVVFPPLGLFVGLLLLVWKLGLLIQKFEVLWVRLPMIIVGLCLYGLLAIAPDLIQANSDVSAFVNASPWLARLLLGMFGMLFPVAAVRAFGARGVKPGRSACVMLGFSSYFTIFLLTFLLPGAGDFGDGGDGDVAGD